MFSSGLAELTLRCEYLTKMHCTDKNDCLQKNHIQYIRFQSIYENKTLSYTRNKKTFKINQNTAEYKF